MEISVTAIKKCDSVNYCPSLDVFEFNLENPPYDTNIMDFMDFVRVASEDVVEFLGANGYSEHEAIEVMEAAKAKCRGRVSISVRLPKSVSVQITYRRNIIFPRP